MVALFDLVYVSSDVDLEEYHGFVYMKKDQMHTLYLLLIYNVDFSMPIGFEQVDIRLSVNFEPLMNQMTEFRLKCFKSTSKTAFSCMIYNRDKFIQEISIELKADLRSAVKVTTKNYMVPRGFRIDSLHCNKTMMVVSGQMAEYSYLFFYELEKHRPEDYNFPKFAYCVNEMISSKEFTPTNNLKVRFTGANLVVSTGIKSAAGIEPVYRVFNVDDLMIKLKCMETSCIENYRFMYSDPTEQTTKQVRLIEILPAKADHGTLVHRKVINIWLFLAGTLPIIVLAVKFYIDQQKRENKALRLMRLGFDDIEEEHDYAKSVDTISRQETRDLQPVLYRSMAFTEEEE